jgi:hypothetical protein
MATCGRPFALVPSVLVPFDAGFVASSILRSMVDGLLIKAAGHPGLRKRKTRPEGRVFPIPVGRGS